jgi:cytoskeletal protein CcmA (bactofilin family)
MSKSISDICYNRLDLSYNWLDLSNVSNKWRQSYIQGFVDISGGDVIIRHNKLFVGGDVSFNHNLSVSGDVSHDGNLTIKELSTSKRLIIYSNLGQQTYPACKITDISSNNTINFIPNSSSNSINNCIPTGSSVIYAANTDNNINTSILTLTTNANTNCGIVINPSLITISTVNGLTISGDVTFSSKYIVNNILIVSGNVSFNRNLTVSGDVSFNRNLTVSGNVSFNRNLTVSGDVSLNSFLTVSGDVSLKSKLIVSGDVSFNRNLTVSGDVSLINKLKVGGEVKASSFNTTSDYRIKENIQPLNLNFTVDLLNPVSYYNKMKNAPDIGFIAHEVQEYFPELVTGERDGQQTQSINYNGLIPILVKELQELKKRCSLLETRNASKS